MGVRSVPVTPRREDQSPPSSSSSPIVLASCDELIDLLTGTTTTNHSALSIKRCIDANEQRIAEWRLDDWDEITTELMRLTLRKREFEFVADISSALIKFPLFDRSFAVVLLAKSSQIILEQVANEEFDTTCGLLSAFIACHWGRGTISRATLETNPVLFLTISIILGWLSVLRNHTPQEENETPPTANVVEPDAGEGGSSEVAEIAEDEDEEEVEETYSDEQLNRVALALCRTARMTGRTLWMKQPELCNTIYKIVRRTVTHCSLLSGDTKDELLSLLFDLNSWTKPTGNARAF